ncbi:MAG TPA: hypothetical protein VN766_11785 [Stellaceae bacterium]|jgi:hypothetical protein|nr:hypothetical protein [Stellaceae bacterium]
MNATIKAAMLSFALAGGVLALGAPANAEKHSVTIAVQPPIAFGYNDGYWDQDHHWHGWRDRDEAARWRSEHRDHFYARNHDRERDEGWREHDHWWGHDHDHD